MKKKKIRTMNNKMAINKHLLTVESKNPTMHTRRIMDMESILIVARWERGVGERVKR